MSAKPLAEAYEKFKELRRQGELSVGLTEDECMTLLAHTVSKLAPEMPATDSNLIRLLEIKPLADRIFGDEHKADSWLNRENPSFSGQKPIDLLKDELGTAVVREALEQIDHGIFS